MPDLSPNIAALVAMLDVPLALHGLTVPEIRVVATILERKGAVAVEVLPEGVRTHVQALAQHGPAI